MVSDDCLIINPYLADTVWASIKGMCLKKKNVFDPANQMIYCEGGKKLSQMDVIYKGNSNLVIRMTLETKHIRGPEYCRTCFE